MNKTDKDLKCEKAVKSLREKLIEGENAQKELWDAVLAYQNYPFYTASGLSFSYVAKQNKKGNYTAELVVSRKEGSKTLTKSSVMLAFQKVTEAMAEMKGEKETPPGFRIPEYKGPKAIGQIFGISYVYSMFWRMGLIRVPEKIEEKLWGEECGR